MERLTNNVYIMDSSCNVARCGFLEIFNRLKDYEDLGLTPEEIRDIISEKDENNERNLGDENE